MPEFLYGSGPPKPVPPMKPQQIAEGVSLVRPLTRKGIGPGMIILAPNDERKTAVDIEDGIPSLRMKWAEEGYCVAEIRSGASPSALKTAVAKLSECHECEPKEKMGIMCKLSMHDSQIHFLTQRVRLRHWAVAATCSDN